MGAKIILIEFKNLKDFQRRIARLWINQKENEIYDFIFPDIETEKAFEDLKNCFAKS
jgi:hypothetical protein